MPRFGLVLSVAATTCCLSGCAGYVKGEGFTARPAVGGFRDSAVQPGQVAVTLDLPTLIGSYVTPPYAPATARPLEEVLAKFDAQAEPQTSEGAAPAAPTLKDKRNALVGAVLMASDQNCDAYLMALRENQVRVRVFSSVLATAFSGAAAVTTPIKSANVLSALGAASSGIGGNINDAAFANQTVEAIATSIRADRLELREDIEEHMTREYRVFPLSQALSELATYHGRCNLMTGLGLLQKTAGKSEEQARSNLEERRKERAGDERQDRR